MMPPKGELGRTTALDPKPLRTLGLSPKPIRFVNESKPRTYNPWELDMTLCVGAQCLWDGEVAIVGAFDERVETNMAGSNSEFKYTPLNGSWGAYLAGPVAQARELIEIYIEHLASAKITRSNVIEQLRIPARKMKARLANTVTHQLVSLSHEEFLKRGQQSFTQEMCRHVEMQIASARFEAQLILAGLVDGSPSLFAIDADDVHKITNFATIGSGSSIAQSVLYQREQSPLTDISRTLYSVYEAMRLGRNAPGVGPCRIMMVLSASKDSAKTPMLMTMLAPESLEVLGKLFEAFGPKPIPDTIPMLMPSRVRQE